MAATPQSWFESRQAAPIALEELLDSGLLGISRVVYEQALGGSSNTSFIRRAVTSSSELDQVCLIRAEETERVVAGL